MVMGILLRHNDGLYSLYEFYALIIFNKYAAFSLFFYNFYLKQNLRTCVFVDLANFELGRFFCHKDCNHKNVAAFRRPLTAKGV